MKKSESVVREIAALADVQINGDRDWDIQVHNARFYERMLRDGSIALGESYVDGWWDVEHIDDLIFRLLRANLEYRISPFKVVFPVIKSKLINLQSHRRAFHVGEYHYDLGNDLYQAMLDKRLTYTCGYWRDADDLDAAQEAKLDLVCRKIGLAPHMTVLDIGCGWGSFAKFAAEKYGATVTGVTVSKEQVELGSELCDGLPVELRLEDYRDVKGRYDRIVSLGMFEHVGPKNYSKFMNIVNTCLADDGVFLLHTIGVDLPKKAVDPWIHKYIFPGAALPTEAQIIRAVESLFIMEDWHNFGSYYDPTLMAWMANVDRHWPELNRKYGERFYRMWKFFLLCNAGSFRARRSQVWQIVFTKRGKIGGYRSVR